MLKFKLLFENGDIVRYQYYPEGKQNSGIVEFDKKTNKGRVVRKSDESELEWYTIHMFSKLRQFSKNKDYQREGTIAWY